MLLFALIELLLEVLLEVRHELFRLLSEHEYFVNLTLLNLPVSLPCLLDTIEFRPIFDAQNRDLTPIKLKHGLLVVQTLVVRFFSGLYLLSPTFMLILLTLWILRFSVF